MASPNSFGSGSSYTDFTNTGADAQYGDRSDQSLRSSDSSDSVNSGTHFDGSENALYRTNSHDFISSTVHFTTTNHQYYYMSPPGPAAPPPEYRCTHPGCYAPPFQTQDLLNSHCNVHTVDQPYFCPRSDCPRSQPGKGVKRKNEMLRHGLVHEMPAKVCPFCAYKEHRYPRKENLIRHVIINHEDVDAGNPNLLDALESRTPAPARPKPFAKSSSSHPSRAVSDPPGERQPPAESPTFDSNRAPSASLPMHFPQPETSNENPAAQSSSTAKAPRQSSTPSQSNASSTTDPLSRGLALLYARRKEQRNEALKLAEGLREENANLRQQATALTQERDGYREDCEVYRQRLKEENADLRRQVAALTQVREVYRQDSDVYRQERDVSRKERDVYRQQRDKLAAALESRTSARPPSPVQQIAQVKSWLLRLAPKFTRDRSSRGRRASI